MNLSKYILPLCYLAILLLACQKVIEIKTPAHKPKNVLNVILTADSALGGYLYETVAVLSNDSFKPIANASMKIFDENNNQVAYQLLSTNGAYFSNSKAKEFACYTIEFNSELGESNGICCIPAAPTILQVDTAINSLLGDTVLRIKVLIKDSFGYKNFYRFTCNAYEIDKVQFKLGGGIDTTWKWVTKSFTNNNISLFVNEYNYANNAYILHDESIDGQTFEVDFSIPIKGKNIKKVMLNSDAIDENVFKYYRTLTAQQFFSTDPNAHYINVFSNVSNGYGIVGGQNRRQYIYFTR